MNHTTTHTQSITSLPDRPAATHGSQPLSTPAVGRRGRAGPGLTRAVSALTLAASRVTLAVTPPVPAARHLAGDPAGVSARGARPITHRRPTPTDHAAAAEPAGVSRFARIPGRQRPQQQAAHRTCAAPEAARTRSWTIPDTAACIDGPGNGTGSPVRIRILDAYRPRRAPAQGPGTSGADLPAHRSGPAASAWPASPGTLATGVSPPGCTGRRRRSSTSWAGRGRIPRTGPLALQR